MGLLKRLLSLGGKKNKAKKTPIITHNVDINTLPVGQGSRSTIAEEDSEAVANRLLRSSSARYAVVREVSYADLPPMPHPINNVLLTPSASTTSLASSTISQRGTYNVTVHKRQQHTPPEFLNPNPGSEDDITTPRPHRNDKGHKDNSQLLRLRSDPSVASLLDMYDEHGRLPSRAFSNSPPSSPKEGREQKRRSGSTFRELLGDPASVNSKAQVDVSTLEGDISWAERYLRDNDCASSVSSLGLQTPENFDAHFPNDHLTASNVPHDSTFSSDNDLSNEASQNFISSLDVELSITTESPSLDYPIQNIPHDVPQPKTPRRASQVFGFLTNRRKSVIDTERDLPELPSAFSSPSILDSPSNVLSRSHFSSDDSNDSIFAPTTIPATPIPHAHDTPSHHRTLAISGPIPLRRNSISRTRSHSDSSKNHPAPFLSSRETASTVSNGRQDAAPNHADTTSYTPQEHSSQTREVKVLMTVPTTVILTAPTPNAHIDNAVSRSRIPRGPRSLGKSTSRNPKDRRPTLLDRSNSRADTSSSRDPFTAIPRRSKSHRTPSSSSFSFTENNVPQSIRPVSRNKREEPNQKENGLGLTATVEIPFTPLRGGSYSKPSRSLFRTAVDPAMFRPPVGMAPSPASSSEMSPIGQQLMMDVRQQRMKARGVERERSDRTAPKQSQSRRQRAGDR